MLWTLETFWSCSRSIDGNNISLHRPLTAYWHDICSKFPMRPEPFNRPVWNHLHFANNGLITSQAYGLPCESDMLINSAFLRYNGLRGIFALAWWVANELTTETDSAAVMPRHGVKDGAKGSKGVSWHVINGIVIGTYSIGVYRKPPYNRRSTTCFFVKEEPRSNFTGVGWNEPHLG